jgi:hypothetical protein
MSEQRSVNKIPLIILNHCCYQCRRSTKGKAKSQHLRVSRQQAKKEIRKESMHGKE